MQAGQLWMYVLLHLPFGVWTGLTVDVNQVVYLGFDRYIGDQVFDNSPHHNNATLQDGANVTKIRGSCGRCAQLNKGDITLRDVHTFQGIPYIAITVMMMVQLLDIRGTIDLFQTMGSTPRSSGSFPQFQLQSDNGRVRWFHRNERRTTVFSIITNRPVLEPSKWTHVAVTYNGLIGKSQVFIDGKLNIEETKDAGTYLSRDWSGFAGIGKPGGDTKMRGYIDEFYIFNKALTIMDITHITSLCQSSLVFHVGFNKKQKNVYQDDSGLLNDVTLSMPPVLPGKKPEDPIAVDGSCAGGVQISGPTNDLQLDGRTFRNKPIDAVTIAVWFNASSIKGTHYLFDTIGGHSQHKHDQYEFSVDDGAVRWIHRNEEDKTIFSVITDPVVTEKRWVHIVGTYNAQNSKAKVYINGNLNKEGAGSGHLSEDWDGYAGFGKHHGGMMDYDILDEIYMYNRELSPYEIKMLYDNCNYGTATMVPSTFQSLVFFGFDRDSGHTVYDDSGSDNDGLLSKGTTIVQINSTCGHGLRLAGGNILLQGSLMKRKPLFSITIALWVKLENNRGEQTLFMTSSNHGNHHGQYEFLIIDGTVKWFHSNEKSQTVFSIQTETAVVPAGRWTHISGTYTSMGGKSEIYINGALKKEEFTGSGTLSQDWSGRVSIGKFFRRSDDNWVDNKPLIGVIDEFYMFDRALPSTELTLLMQTCDYERVVLHFGFEVFDGRTTYDVSGLANNGKTLKATSTPAGKCGKGMNMTGDIELDGVHFNTSHFREKPQKAISISTWINLATNRGNHEIFNTIGSRSSHKHDQYRLAVETGKVIWSHHQEQDREIFDLETLPVIPARNWTHIVATYSSKAMLAQIYVNGKLIKQKSAFGDLSQDWGHYAGIGRRFYDTDGHFNGIIDNFMMFNYALSQSEITMTAKGECPK